ncbi:hypothetical protein SUGI_0286530 [Cryptomeria japonica]|nr:hypothetical protein SUGI_0286530 [Cryptomeria japonica]
MTMLRQFRALLLAVLVFSALMISAECLDKKKSVYDVLESFQFPRGILPANANNYVLNPDGSFQVFLDGACKIKVAGHKIKYMSNIWGNISPGSLKNLHGVKVKVSFFWVSISEIDVSNGKLKFHVGPFSPTFDASSFGVSPTCR